MLGFLATAPVAVPGIVLGVGLFLSYTRPPFVLYGTLWILLIAFLTINLPSAYQQLQAAFATIHPELEDASRILGATRLQSLRQITAPLLRTGVIATWCFIFIGVMRELSAAIVLFTSQTKVLVGADLRPQRKRRSRRDLGARHCDAGHHLRGGARGQPDPDVRRQRHARCGMGRRLSSSLRLGEFSCSTLYASTCALSRSSERQPARRDRRRYCPLASIAQNLQIDRRRVVDHVAVIAEIMGDLLDAARKSCRRTLANCASRWLA